MVHPLIENGLTLLSMSRYTFDQMLDTLPDDAWLTVPVDQANHALWITGHLAWADAHLLASLGGPADLVPADWLATFGWGSACTNEASVYPDADQVREKGHRARQAVRDFFLALPDEQALAPAPDVLKKMVRQLGGVPGFIAAHEMLHCGQLSVIRKQLGLPPVIG